MSKRTYLVGTHSFLFALDLDANWQVEGYRILHDGHHYGIAFYEDNGRKFLAKQPHSSGNEVNLFEAQPPYEHLGTRAFEDISKSHQMSVANGGIYITNTGCNSIVYYSMDGETRHEYHINGAKHDRNHVNSVFPCGNQVYALLHNSFRRVSQLVVLEHAPETGFTLRHMLDLWNEGCHNIYVEEDLLYYNSSQTGQFVAVDLKTEKVIQKLRYPESASGKFVLDTHDHHTKGMAVTEDHVVVGFSQQASREARRRTRGHLAVIDRHSLTTQAIIDLNFPDLPHPAGNVNEVRCLSEPDLGQANANPLAVDWGQLKLARRNGLEYARTNALVVVRNLGKVGKKVTERIFPSLFPQIGE